MNIESRTWTARLCDFQNNVAPLKTVADGNIAFVRAADGKVLTEAPGGTDEVLLGLPPRPMICGTGMHRLVYSSVDGTIGPTVAGNPLAADEDDRIGDPGFGNR